MSDYLFALAAAFFCGAMVGEMRNSFYRAYFRQKQENAGKDHEAVLREIFPIAWRLLR